MIGTELGASKRRTKVLHVIPTLGPGGSERYLLDLVRTMDRTRFESSVCVLGSVNTFPSRQAGDARTVFLNVGVGLGNPYSFYRILKALRRFFRDWKPDLIHSHLWHATRPVALATIGTHIPHVVHFHGPERLKVVTARDGVISLLVNSALTREETRFIAVSQDTSDYSLRYVASAAGRTVVIRSGVDVDRFVPRRPDPLKSEAAPLTIAMVGWLSEQKGQGLLIQALALLKERGLVWRARFAGAGKMLEPYLATAQKLGVLDQVEFLGPVEDIAGFLGEAEIFVLPSATEGIPLSMLEAMAMGLPVVASRAGGIPEVICHGHDGLLLAERTPLALADALSTLAHRDVRERLGTAAAHAVRERFDFRRTTRAIEDVYEALIR